MTCLDERNPAATEACLHTIGWLEPGEAVLKTARAGQGNMNYVLRVTTAQRSFILKQSRPWVERYPHIAAPLDRALVEADFYRVAAAHSPAVSASMPRLLAFDPRERVLQLEDLGESPAFDFLYRGENFLPGEREALAAYLAGLHSAFTDIGLATRFANCEMKRLNHQHIFRLPFQPGNGLDLDAITPGLAALARDLQNDTAVLRRVSELSAAYLGQGRSLIHGDFFPGSWIRTPDGVRVIDPEFCFFGPPEFDWGVMLAHLAMTHPQPGPSLASSLDGSLMRGFAGVEIMRRLIGVAQLPLSCGLAEKEQLLDRARRFLLDRA